MVRHALPFHFEPLHPAQVRKLMREELGASLRARTGASPSPEIIVFVLAGNLPGLAIWPALLGLAVGAGVVLKPAAGDPVSPWLLLESIRCAAPELAEAVWVFPWRGGDRVVEEALFAKADLVVAQGSDATVTALASWVPCRFLGYGSRLSCAFVAREILEQRRWQRVAALRLATDVTIWDQRGCLSPHVCFVECQSPRDLDSFGELVAAELHRLACILPPRRRTAWEQAAVRSFRDQALWSGARLLGSEADLAWSLAIEREASVQATCGDRCVRMQPVANLDALRAAIEPHCGTLEAVGVAVGRRRHAHVVETLRGAGVANVMRLGSMQRPTLAWKPGGRPRIGEWFV